MSDTSPEQASSRRMPIGVWAGRLAVGAAVWGALVGIWGQPPVRTALAVLAIGALAYPGIAMARSMATPLPPPPEPGTLRKVKLTYRCAVCGAEVRMTSAVEEDPEPPRHCMDDMDLVAPIDDL